MKKLILVLSAIASLLVAGCNQSNQGGTSDQYNTGSGHTNGSRSLGGTNTQTHP